MTEPTEREISHIAVESNPKRSVEVREEPDNAPAIGVKVNHEKINTFFNSLTGSREGAATLILSSSTESKFRELLLEIIKQPSLNKVSFVAFGELFASFKEGYMAEVTGKNRDTIHLHVDKILLAQLLEECLTKPQFDNNVYALLLREALGGENSDLPRNSGNWISQVLQHELDHAAKEKPSWPAKWGRRFKIRCSTALSFLGIVTLSEIGISFPDVAVHLSVIGGLLSGLSLVPFHFPNEIDYDNNVEEVSARQASKVDHKLLEYDSQQRGIIDNLRAQLTAYFTVIEVDESAKKALSMIKLYSKLLRLWTGKSKWQS